jgi:hypothetical protein
LICRYFFDDDHKPQIISINGQTSQDPVPVLSYNQEFTLEWQALKSGAQGANVTRVTLAAASAVTHAFNMNQRVIELRVLQSTSGQVRLLTPLDAATAPPQLYMIFPMNGKTYGPAKWIKLAPGQTLA